MAAVAVLPFWPETASVMKKENKLSHVVSWAVCLFDVQR
jgi:hypothetical protein